ncbi:MAG: sigma-70 family RNA polymerase sigma factor [Ardenticatenales bacterium]|nr:sigma-70 family RNA polymerase sigma factor [Ardenticatenales bacterium]
MCLTADRPPGYTRASPRPAICPEGRAGSLKGADALVLDGDVDASVRDALEGLVRLGASRGYVTASELSEQLPEAEDDPGIASWCRACLDAADIEIVADEVLPSDEMIAEVAEDLEGELTLDHLVSARPASMDGIEDDDSVSLYFREVGAVPLLTREEEVALAKRIERGRGAGEELGCPDLCAGRRRALQRARQEGSAAWDHLVKANSRLVISMAKKYRGQGVPFLDLIQEGNVGLMKAADKFDHRRGYKFSTYATWWIRQSITRALANQGRTIRVPVHMSDRIRKLFAIAQAMEQDLGRRPTPAELASRMDLPELKVRQMLKAARRSLSLEKPVGDDLDSELGFFIEDVHAPDPLETAAFALMQVDLDDVLLCLTAREARIVRLRYGLDNGQPLTLKEVGRKFNLTRERIRQIEQEALLKLRQPHRQERLLSYLR